MYIEEKWSNNTWTPAHQDLLVSRQRQALSITPDSWGTGISSDLNTVWLRKGSQNMKGTVIIQKCSALTLGWKGQDGSAPALRALGVSAGAGVGAGGPRGPLADHAVPGTRDFTSHHLGMGKLWAQVMWCFFTWSKWNKTDMEGGTAWFNSHSLHQTDWLHVKYPPAHGGICYRTACGEASGCKV